jgi:dynein heavy chain
MKPTCHVDSLSVFVDEMEPGHARFPLFEVSLQLQEPYVVFIPSLNADDSKGFYHLVDSLLHDIVQMSALVQRVARHISQTNYKVITMSFSNVNRRT